MSRSKHIDPAAPAPSRPAAVRRVFLGGDGALRGGWIAALCGLGWAAVTLAARLGLGLAFDGLFDAWGINAGNAHLAPAWARVAYAWHGSAITAAQALAVIAVALALRRLLRVPKAPWGSVKRGGRMALAGLGGAVLLAALFMIADSLRPEWSLLRPRFSAGLPALLAISLLSTLAGELLTKRALLDALRPRWGAGWASLAATLLFFLGSGGYAGGVVGAVNTLLLGALCCAIYLRTGSLWNAVGLRWGWSAANLLLLGYGGGASAVYRLYGVSEGALTGGDRGLMYGLGATLLLLAGLGWLVRERVGGILRGLKRRAPAGK